MIRIYAARIQNKDQHGTAEKLLNRSLERCIGLKTPVHYHRNKHGKPYLTERSDIYVNWSHSGDYVVCVVSDREVGIDLQKMDREPGENLFRKALTETERKSCEGMISEDRKRRFYEYWSIKESFLKALGTGFHISLSRFEVMFLEGVPVIEQQVNDKNYACRLLSFREPGYAAAICVEDYSLKEEELEISYMDFAGSECKCQNSWKL